MFHLVVSFSIMRAAALSILVFYKNNLQKCIEKWKPAAVIRLLFVFALLEEASEAWDSN